MYLYLRPSLSQCTLASLLSMGWDEDVVEKPLDMWLVAGTLVDVFGFCCILIMNNGVELPLEPGYNFHN